MKINDDNTLKKIVILDFMSEKNLGDAAIQVGLLKILRESFPQATIAIMTSFGANQLSELGGEFTHSLSKETKLFGGLVPTFYPFRKTSFKNPLYYETSNFFHLLLRVWLLIALKIGIPKKVINQLLGKQYRPSFDLIMKADLVVVRGRNYRSRKSPLLEIIRMLSKVYHPLLCGLLKKKMILVGASIWEQKSRLAMRFLGAAFRPCSLIAVRDKNSLEMAKIISEKNKSVVPIFLPDLAFSAFGKREELIRKRKLSSQADHPETIGLTLLDWNSDEPDARGKYQQSISNLISYYSALGSRIVIIPQVSISWDDSSALLQGLTAGASPDAVTVIRDDLSLEKLIELYSGLDILVGTRMHSTIFAAIVNTPFVAIANDAGGKWGIIEELGYKDYLINYKEITPDLLIEKTSECWRNREKQVRYASEVVEKYTCNISDLVTALKSLPE